MFRAFDPESDRLVAVKLFRLDLPPERVHQLVAEFERVIELQLAHPAIAAPVATGIAGAQAFLAAEFVSADSLDVVMRESGPAPIAHAIKVAAQLAGAIDYAAAVNVAHGALHPRDILVSAEDTRITGFGIAQALNRVGVAVPLRRPYTAPEHIDDRNHFARDADIFAVAAIICELLTGRRIAGAGTGASDALSTIAGLDVALAQAVFARALAADPKLRFETALQFVEALKQALEAAPALPSLREDVEQEPRLPLEGPPPVVPLAADEPSLVDRSDSVVVPNVPPPSEARPAPEPSGIEPPQAAAPAPAPVVDPADLDVASAEAERYRDVESAPAIVPEAAEDLLLARPADQPVPSIADRLRPGEQKPDSPDRPAARTPSELPVRPVSATADVEPLAVPASRPMFGAEPASALERSRSAMWPLLLALLVGLALGFAGGYDFGTRGQAPTAIPRSGPDRKESVAADTPPAALPSESLPSGSTPAPAPRTPAKATSGEPSAAQSESSSAATGQPAVGPGQRGPAVPHATPERSVARGEETGAEDGRILVRSTPDGARVYVDGRERGRTPLALRDLARGAHHVRIEREGYETEERRVVLTARRPSESMEIALSATRAEETPARTSGETFVGTLIVESRPTGASVYVDGRLAGRTPLQLSDVAAGSHVVRLEHDGYRRWSSAVRVVTGERNRVTASLEK